MYYFLVFGFPFGRDVNTMLKIDLATGELIKYKIAQTAI